MTCEMRKQIARFANGRKWQVREERRDDYLIEFDNGAVYVVRKRS